MELCTLTLLFWKKKPKGTVRLIVRSEVRLMKEIDIPAEIWFRRESAMQQKPEEKSGDDLAAVDAFSEAVNAQLPSLEDWDRVDLDFEHYERIEENELEEGEREEE